MKNKSNICGRCDCFYPQVKFIDDTVDVCFPGDYKTISPKNSNDGSPNMILRNYCDSKYRNDLLVLFKFNLDPIKHLPDGCKYKLEREIIE